MESSSQKQQPFESSQTPTTVSDHDIETNTGDPNSISHREKADGGEIELVGQEDPKNWSIWNKSVHIITPSWLCLAVTVTASIYVPGYTDVMAQFNVGEVAAILPFTTFVLGLSFGPLLAAPLSESQGRRFVYIYVTPLFALFVLGSGFAPTFAGLLILRFFAGVFGSPPLAVSAATATDLFPAAQRCVGAAPVAVIAIVGPVLGPLVGAYVAERKGWRWTQWTSLFFIISAYIPTLIMKETYSKVLLREKAKRIGKEVIAGPKGATALKLIATITLIRPMHMLFNEPMVICSSIYVAFLFGTVYSCFVAFPYVFTVVYGFTPEQNGLPFIALIVGCFLGAVVAISCDIFIYQAHLKVPHAKVIPEKRLWAAIYGSFMVPIGLFWFGWSARPDVHWICPILSGMFISCGNVSIYGAVALYLIDAYESHYSASALAANGLLRYIVGACFPLFTIQMYERLGIDWASSLLGFISLLLLPIPWVLYKYGHQLRLKSHYETSRV
ncbi:Polyamine transporter 4-like protein 1 [Phlyctema vagabunda]|uniref:Polyamine transporter 4-like protein 1 n=1 Tax=Phlyctema vagabunda TaxID=108571 RepID=A0ABR4PQ63_9HELO